MLHVIYRSHGGENMKGRPAWYDKRLALESVIRAALSTDAPVELLFLNDGPITDSRLDLMQRYGEVIRVDKGSNRGSYLEALTLPRRRGWVPEDLVLFAEDDYLYLPTSFTQLIAAAGTAQADYFAPYAELLPTVLASHSQQAEAGWSVWVPHHSTTSTFAVRAGVLYEDVNILRLCPFSGGAWDETSCLCVQGRRPFRLRDLLMHHPGPDGTAWPRRMARHMFLDVTKTAVYLRSHRRPSRRRVLVAAAPAVATHMELGVIGIAVDWERVADETRAWAGAALAERTTGGLSGTAESTDT